MVIAAVLLVLVFVPGVGVTNYGATRWIGFGSFTIQPSEVAKYAFALFAAAYFAWCQQRLGKPDEGYQVM